MLRLLLDAQLRGRVIANGRLSCLPQVLVHDQDRATRGSISAVVELEKAVKLYVEKLMQLRAAGIFDATSTEEDEACEVLLETLQVIKNKVRNENGIETAETKEEAEFCRSFVAARGWEVLLEFVERLALPFLAGNPSETMERNVSDICNYCLSILKDLCFSVPELAQAFGERDDLICAMVKGLVVHSLFEHVAMFCETILNARKSAAFDMRKVESLDELVLSMNACQLVYYARIVSCVTIDPVDRIASNSGKNLESFALLNHRRRVAVGDALGTDVVVTNHSRVVVPAGDLLPRLVQLLEDKRSDAEEKMLWLGRSNTYWMPKVAESVPPTLDTIGLGTTPGMTLEQRSRLVGSFVQFLERIRISRLVRAIRRIIRAAWAFFTKRNPNAPPEPPDNGPASDDEVPLASIEDPDEASGMVTNAAMDEDFVVSPFFWNNQLQRELWQLTQRLDVACALGTLCSGPSKRLVQDKMNFYGLIPALNQRFDSLPWDPSLRYASLPATVRIHGAGCECDPHGAFKAQLLRLAHNFCDRESDNQANKYALLSSRENQALSWDYRSSSTGQAPPFGWERINIHFPGPAVRAPGTSDREWAEQQELDAMQRLRQLGLPGGCPADHGFAWRVAAVLIAGDRLTGDASLNFWIFAALEALLRGAPSQLKMMVCAWGVLHALVSSLCRMDSTRGARRLGMETPVVADAAQNAGYFQTSFDLLGELVKDNPDALGWLCGKDCALLGPAPQPPAFDQVAALALTHLVDGNVFLRAVSLTLHRAPTHQPIDLARVWLAENSPLLVRGLWLAVNLEYISQENLCCLNTAVVLLTFARWGGDLLAFLGRVADVDLSEKDSAFTEQLFVLKDQTAQEHFRKLLWFWRCYYSCRPSDRMSIEYSSGISFDDIQTTVRRLCEKDSTTGLSILTGDKVIHVPYVGGTLAVTCPVDLVAWDGL